MGLESKDLVTKLADRTCLGKAKGLGSLLDAANHRRRTAQEELDILGGLREPFLKTVSD